MTDHQPVRFQHIGLTAHTSLLALQTSVVLRDLRQTLTDLDKEIADMRDTLNPPSSPLRTVDGDEAPTPAKVSYEAVTDSAKLRRLVTAREKTRTSLEQKAAWVGLERSKAAEAAAS